MDPSSFTVIVYSDTSHTPEYALCCIVESSKVYWVTFSTLSFSVVSITQFPSANIANQKALVKLKRGKFCILEMLRQDYC